MHVRLQVVGPPLLQGPKPEPTAAAVASTAAASWCAAPRLIGGGYRSGRPQGCGCASRRRRRLRAAPVSNERRPAQLAPGRGGLLLLRHHYHPHHNQDGGRWHLGIVSIGRIVVPSNRYRSSLKGSGAATRRDASSVGRTVAVRCGAVPSGVR